MTNETNNTSSIISKVWSFCNTLRDDCVGYGDYLEQLTFLLFLKMADEFSKPPYNLKITIPKDYNWESLAEKRGAVLEVHYTKMIEQNYIPNTGLKLRFIIAIIDYVDAMSDPHTMGAKACNN